MQFGQLWDFADGGAETSSGVGLELRVSKRLHRLEI